MAPLGAFDHLCSGKRVGCYMDQHIRLGKFLIISFIIPFVIYASTVLPYVDFWDTGEFQTVAYTFDIAHPTGYPTYIVLGKIFTSIFNFGSIAFRMNFLSVILSSFGLLFLSLSIYKVSKNIIISIFLPVLFSVNPYLWSISLRADPHALHFFFTTLFIYLFIKAINERGNKHIYLISFISGLSLGNQLLSIFFLPALFILYLYLLRISPSREIVFKKIIISLLFLLLGTSIYTILPIISGLKGQFTVSYYLNDWEGFIRHVLGQDFQNSMFNWNKGNFQQTLNFYFELLNKGFPGFLWVFIPAGLFVSFFYPPSRRGFHMPAINLAMLAIYISTLLFGMNYQNAVIERYFIPSFTISIIWISVFFAFLIKKAKNHFITFEIYLLILLGVLFLFFSNFKNLDQSKNLHAAGWATDTFSSIERDGVVMSWWSYSTPLWYMQKVEGYRRDVIIVNASDWEWENLSQNYSATRPVYFINEIELINKGWKLIRTGTLYKLDGPF
jgi:hypothetical protein